MKTTSYISRVWIIAIFILFSNSTITKSQTLFEDVEEIANLIENPTIPVLYLITKDDVSVNYKYTYYEDGFPMDIKKTTLLRWKATENSVDTIQVFLRDIGIYNIDFGKDDVLFKGWISYNDNKLEFEGSQLKAFEIINDLEKCMFKVLKSNQNKIKFSKPNLLKTDLIKLYGLLGKHSKAFRDTSINMTASDVAKKFNFINQSEFLQPAFQNTHINNISPQSKLDLGLKIQDSIQIYMKSDYSPSELLYGKNQINKFQSLKELQLSYKETPVESVKQLQQISSQLQLQEQKIESTLNAVNIAAGLSDFIVERAQEEFNIEFMDRLRVRLNDTTYPEFGALFPNSRSFFDKEIEVVNYKNILPKARQAFISDMQNLHHHIHNLLLLDDYEKLNNNSSVFNLVLFYEMADLVYQDISLDTIMPVAYNMLVKRQQDLDQKIYISLADTLIKNYSPIVSLKDDIINTNNAINEASKNLAKEVLAIGNKLNDTIDALRNKMRKPDENAATFEKMSLELIDFQNKFYDETTQKNTKLYNFLGSFEIEGVEENLNGNPNYDKIFDQPTLAEYSNIFENESNFAPKELIASGLRHSKTFYNTTNTDSSFILFLIDYRKYLLDIENHISNIESITISIEQKSNENLINSFNKKRDSLSTLLNNEINSLNNNNNNNNNNVNINDLKAIEYLNDILSLRINPIEATSTQNSFSYAGELQLKANQIDEIKRHLIERLEKIESNSTYKSKLLVELKKPKSTLVPPIPDASLQILYSIKDTIERIFSELKQIEKSNSPKIVAARNNAQQFAQVLELSSELLYCFKVTPTNDNKKKFASKDMLRNLLANPLHRDIYLGLLQERLSNTSNLGNISSEGIASLTSTLIGNIQIIAEQRDTLANKKENQNSILFKDYYPLIKSGVNIINALIETPLFNNLALKDTRNNKSLGYIPEVSRNVLSLFEHIYGKDYGLAIYDALDLLLIFEKEKNAPNNETDPLTNDDLFIQTAETKQLKSIVLKYGTFMADVASATTSDEVKYALRSATLPPGSSKIKRYQDFNVSVNSYLMFSSSRDFLTNSNINPDANQRWGSSFGLSVPIGVAISFRSKFIFFKNYQSVSLFTSILDLGAVTTYRIDNRDSLNYSFNDLPEFSFSNLIAPGAHLYYNFKNAPISLGIGAQYGPQLREITVTNIDGSSRVDKSGSWRFMLNLGIDVPFFNLSKGSDKLSRKERRKLKKARKAVKKRIKDKR